MTDMPEIKLGKVYFKPSQIYKYGLYQCTAKCGEDQYDMSEEAWSGRVTARKRFKTRAYDYFVCFYKK